MNHFGGLDVAPGCHCRVQWTWCHCHCSVLWWGEEGDGQLWGVDVVPLQGSHSSVLDGGDDQLWRSGRGAIAGCHCHCSVLWWGEEGDGQLWGSGRGAIAGCHSSVLDGG